MAESDREADAPRVAIVSTSVNPDPIAYVKWAEQGDLIVAGDLNSPLVLRGFVEDLGGEYLSPKEQEWWSFSDIIGWNTIQRRNAAVMVAYSRRYDYVITVDDDNHASPGWVTEHVAHLRGDLPASTVLVEGDNGWVDPGMLVMPRHHQRGVPYGVARYHTVHGITRDVASSVVVSTAQVLGDPDCDAVTRLTQQPSVNSVQFNAVVHTDDWTAFNSQATAWLGSWSPLIACIPHVGRYDDILASFIAKRIMRAYGKTVYVGEPSVVQRRNEHDIVNDLREEYYGMGITPYVIRALNSAALTSDMTLSDAYGACIDALTWHNALRPDALEFMELWRQTWDVYESCRKRYT